MGGDGGTISSSRLYLRGAGKASHTADHPSHAHRLAHKRSKADEAERCRVVLNSCAISGRAFDFSPGSNGAGSKHGNNGSNGDSTKGDGGGGDQERGGGVSTADIVACPYGKLYLREAALEALLDRKASSSSSLGSHVRGMKDLHPVRFHVRRKDRVKGDSTAAAASSTGTGIHYAPTCPITGADIGEGGTIAYVIVRNVPKKSGGDDDEVGRAPNVLGERAIEEMGVEELQSEYGPFDECDMIRLAPPEAEKVFENIRAKWEARMEEELLAKLQKKKDKKRKRNGGKEADGEEAKTSVRGPPSAGAAVGNGASRPSQPPPLGGGSKSESRSHHARSNVGKMGERKSGDGRRTGIASATSRRTTTTAAEQARSSVRSAVAQNAVLSSMFVGGTTTKTDGRSEKERKNALFTNNC